MPQINLGHVKGDPLTWEDLTEEQKLSLKGEKGNTPVVKAGQTTIVEYDQGAKVTSQTTGDVTSFDFQIPVGQEPPFYGAYATFPIPGNVNRTYIDDTVDPRLMYTWSVQEEKYILTGGSGGADGSSIDIPVTLLHNNWMGETAVSPDGESTTYSQTVTVPQMREGMTPLYFFSGAGDAALYAYSLITGYNAGYAQITFYAADFPEVDIALTLKGVPAQQLEYADNTVVVVVPAEGWVLNEDLDNRYEQTIPVEGIAAEAQGGGWDIVRSGAVLSLEESKICANITDVIPLDGAIKIVCLEPPAQQYMLKLSGTYTQATEGTTLLAGMQEWFDRVEALESNYLQREVTSTTPEISLTFSGMFSALITFSGWNSNFYGAYILQGFGGDTTRFHVVELQKGSAMTYIVDENLEKITFNVLTGTRFGYSILMLQGLLPSIS